MALLGCYLDDSRDRESRIAIAVAGYYGWSLAFIDAERHWEKCLKRHRLAYFKASECEYLHGEFFRFRRDPNLPTREDQLKAAAAIRSEFIQIINDSNLEGIGLGMSIGDFERVRNTEPVGDKVLAGGAFNFIYHSLMIELVKRAEERFSSHLIGFVCDEHSDWQAAEAAYRELLRLNPKSAQMMASMSHADDKVFLPLQMADLLAYETRLAKEATMRGFTVNERQALLEVADSILGFHNLTEEYLRAVVRDLKRFHA